MKKYKIQVFYSYLRYRFMYILFLLLFIGTFSIPCLLYHLPVSIILYALSLSLFITLLLFLKDYIDFDKKQLQLSHMLMQDVFDSIELPKPNNLLEEDYTKLLCRLSENKTKLLSEADRKNTEMLEYYTMWVHQIKVPISAMRLLLHTDTGKVRQEELKKELFKIEQYVEMVLQYIRMDSMNLDLVFKEYSLSDIVKQAVRKYSLLFIYSKLSLNLEEFDCKVITDEKWLVFVLEQILSNAIKYTKIGMISIYMDPVEPATLVIEDTGIGIEEEDIKRVFEKGFTGYNGRMDKKSTGIGLYLSKQILNKLSHTICISSEVGKGTKVKISMARENLLIE